MRNAFGAFGDEPALVSISGSMLGLLCMRSPWTYVGERVEADVIGVARWREDLRELSLGVGTVDLGRSSANACVSPEAEKVMQLPPEVGFGSFLTGVQRAPQSVTYGSWHQRLSDRQ